MHQQTSPKRELLARTLRQVLLGGIVLPVLLLVALSVRPLWPGQPIDKAAAATSSTLNFQARLRSATGSTVPDGNYHIQFRLYNGASGGAAVWTESRTTGNLVRVANGYLSVNLGSVTAFPAGLNWDQDLYLTMNIGGAGGSAVWDGEMTPRIKLTAVPYAFRAGGITSTQGSYTGTLDFTTLTGNQSVLLPNASGTVCLTTGNCAGAGGNGDITGSGTAGRLAVFDAAKNITNSWWLQTGSTMQLDSGRSLNLVSGNLTLANGNIDVTGNILASGNGQFGSLSVGTAANYGAITLANNQWLTGVNAAGNAGINILKVNAQNQIQLGSALSVDGGFIFPSDAGLVSFTDMPITNASAAGAVNGYTLGLDAENVMTIYGESDGAGGVQNLRVGIGTTAPSTALQVNGTATATLFSGSGANLTNLNASNISAGTLSDARLSTNVALYNATTANFTGTLQQSGNNVCTTAGNCTLGSGVGSGSAILQGGNSFGTAMTIGTNDNYDLNFETNGTTKLTVLANGNVGVGAATPGEKLTVNGNIHLQDNNSLYLNTAKTSSLRSDGASLFITPPTGNRTYFQGSSTGILSSLVLQNTSTAGTAGSGMLFAAGAESAFIGGVATARTDASLNAEMYLRILANGVLTDSATSPIKLTGGATNTIYLNGNVGIGTTAPGYKLDVQGGTGIVGQFSGRVIGGNAVNANEFVTKSQLDTAAGGAAADGVTSLNALEGALTIQGSSQIGVAAAGSAISLSIQNDSITDTQLQYNTGQHLTTTSNVSFNQLTLGATTGTAPLVVSSTTKVANLNADLLDGLDSSNLGRRYTHAQTVTAGQTKALARFYDTEGTISVLIQVQSETNGHSGTKTYQFQGGYNQLGGAYPGNWYKMQPLTEGRGHGDSTDGFDVYVRAGNDAYTYDFGIAANTNNKTLTTTFTDLTGSGATYTDISAEAAVASSSAGDVYSHRSATFQGNVALGTTSNSTYRLNVNGSANATNLFIGGVEVLTAARVLQNVTADASILTSGTLADARLSTNVALYNAATSNFTGTLQQGGSNVCTVAGNCAGVGGTGDILQGGNSFGTAMTIGTNDNQALNFETNGTTKLTVLANGNVGIGTTSPDVKLSIAGSSGIINSGGYMIHVGAIDTSVDTSRQMIGFSHGNSFSSGNVRAGIGSIVSTGGAGNLVFETGTAGAQTERMRINGSGNVGIGTTTPSTALQVNGTATATLFSGSGANLTGLNASNIATGTLADARLSTNVALYNRATSNFTGTLQQGGNSVILQNGNTLGQAMTIGTNDNFDLNLETNGTTKLTVLANGNVGIGTVSPSTKLQVNSRVGDDNSRVYDPNALMVVHQTRTSTTALNDPEEVLYLGRQGTPGEAYGAMATFKLSRYESISTNSRTRLDLDLTHNNFNDVNVMTLLSSGNVGIGTPAPGYKLDVQGGSGIVGQFSGRVIGANAVNANEFVTKSQLDTAAGGAAADGVTSLNTLEGALTIQGSTQIGVAAAGSTISLSIQNDSIDDTQLAFNTGQHLTTTSAPTFAGLTVNGTTTMNVGRGDVYFENNSNDNVDGAGVTLRTSINPTSGAIFAVRSSGQAPRLWVGQSVTSTGINPLYVGTTNDGFSTPAIQLLTNGDASFSGTATATLFSGSGASLTNLNASNIATGTVADARLSTNVALYNRATSNFTGALQQNGSNVCTVAGNCAGIGGTGDILQGGNSFGTAMTIGTNDNFDLNLKTNGTTKLTVLANGNVGIGSLNPSAKLHVQGSDDTAQTVLFAGGADTAATGVAGMTLQVKAGGGQTADLQQWQNSSGNILAKINAAGNFVFGATSFGAGSSNNGSFTSEGRLLLNPSAATHNFFVGGGVDAGLAVLPRSANTAGIVVRGLSSQTGDLLQLQNSSGTVLARVDASGNGYFNNGSGTAALPFVQGGNSFGAEAVLGTNDNQNLSFETNGTTKLTVLANGDVGIGTMGPTERLEVNGNIMASGSLTASSLTSSAGGIGQYQNLLLRSEEFNSSPWAKDANVTVTANQAVAPDGSTTADQIDYTSSANENSFYQNSIAAASDTFTFSVWARSVSGTSTIRLFLRETAGGSPGGISRKDIVVDTTWRRYSVTGTFSGAASNVSARLVIPGGTATAIYAWGAQLEQSSQPNTYIRTSASNVSSVAQGLVVNAGGASIFQGGNVGIGTTAPSTALQVNGTATATLFSGSGASLTNLNASNIATGTVADARLSTNVALYNRATSNFTGALQQNGSNVCTVAGNCAGIGGTGDILQGGNSFGTAMTIGTNDNFDLNLETNGTTKLTVLANGSVGIGTGAPGTKLTIAPTSAGDGLAIMETDGENEVFDIQAYTNDAVVTLKQGGATNIKLYSGGDSFFNSGNVGIGTTTPSTALQVNGTVTATLFSGSGASLTNLNASNISTGTLADARLSTNVALYNAATSNFTGTLQQGGNSVILQNGNTLGQAITVGTNDNFDLNLETNGTTKLTVLANGNVGVGTTTPGAKLHIADSAISNFRLERSGAAYFQIQSPGGAPETTKFIVYDVGTATSKTAMEIITHSGGGHNFGDVIFNGGGNVGIGTTTPGTALQVNGTATATLFSGSGASLTNLNASNIATGTLADARLSTNVALYNAVTANFTGTLQQGGNSVILQNGNTLGQAMTIGTNDNFDLNLKTNGTTKLTVLANGNVGIGETAPGAKLQVNIGAAGTVGQIIKAAASQTADLQQWQNSSGAVLTSINNTGQVVFDPNGSPSTISNVGSYLTLAGGANGIKLLGGTGASNVLVQSATSGSTVLVVKGAASQTGDLWQLQNSGGTVLSKFDANGNLSVGTSTSPTGGVATFNGNVGIGTTAPSAKLHVQGSDDTAQTVLFAGGADTAAAGVAGMTLTVKAGGGQTADLQQWQNSSGTVMARVDKDGNGYFNNISAPSVNAFGTDDAVLSLPFNNSLAATNGTRPSVASGALRFGTSKFDKALTVEESTTNLIVNPSFETDTTSWTPFGGTVPTVATSTEQKHSGSKSMKITWPTAGDGASMVRYVENTAAANTTYTVSAYVYVPSGQPQLQIYVAGNVTAATYSNTSNTNNQWQWLKATVTTGDSTGNVQIHIRRPYATTAGQYGYVDSVQMEQKGYATSYTDGSLGTGYAWTGTAHASTSTRVAGQLSYPSNVLSTSSGTVSAYVHHDIFSHTPTLTREIFAWGPGSDSALRIFQQYGNQIRATVFGNAGGSVVTSNGGMNHVALAWDASNGYLYWNGQLIQTIAKGTSFPNQSTFYVGTTFDQARFADAAIDNMTIWNRALSGAEVTALANAKGTTSNGSSIAISGFSDTTAALTVSQSGQANAFVIQSAISPTDQALFDALRVDGSGKLTVGNATTIINRDAAAVSLTVRGAASQTADLLQWQDSSGLKLISVTSSGVLRPAKGIGTESDGQIISIGGGSNPVGEPNIRVSIAGTVITPWRTADRLALIVKGLASQTADLQQFQNSSGTTLSKFDANGNLSVGTSTSPTGGVATFNGNVGIGTTTPSTALQVNGTATATLFSGSGASLTNLNASNISTGTLADARLSTNVALLDRAGQTFSGANTFSAAGTALTVTNNAVIGGTLSVGTAANYGAITLANNQWLTGVNAAGNAGINILKVNAQNQIQLGSALSVDGGFIFPSDAGLVSFTDMPITNASAAGAVNGYTFGLDAENVMTIYGESDGAGGVQNLRVGIGTSAPSTALQVNGTATATLFSGSGASLTNLNASNIASGTLDDARLSTNVALYNRATSNFTGTLQQGGNSVILQNGNTLGQAMTIGTNDNQALNLETNGTTKLTVLANGNVGIGDTTPDYKLEIQGSSGSGYFAVTNSTDGDIFAINSSGTAAFGGNVIQVGNGVNALGDQESMVPNAGFEVNDDATTNIADGWTFEQVAGTPSASFNSSSPAQGSYAMDITTTATSDHGRLTSGCFPVTVGNDYVISAKVKSAVAASSNLVLGFITYSSKANCVNNTSSNNLLETSLVNTGTSYSKYSYSPNTGIPSGYTWARASIASDTPSVATTTSFDAVRVTLETSDQGVDLAENFPALKSDDLRPGELVSFGSPAPEGGSYAVRSSSPYDRNLFGVVSTQPGLTLDDGRAYEKVAVALTGRVPVKVNGENGAIAVGDPITASSIPGVGMKATAAGRIIGTAVTAFDGTGEGTITALINPEFWAPPINDTLQAASANFTSLQVSGNASIASLQVSGNAAIASLNVSGRATVDTLVVRSDATIEGGLTVRQLVVKQRIVVEGHYYSVGQKPLADKGTDLGTDLIRDNQLVLAAKVELDGTDTAGTITIVAGQNAQQGVLGKIMFHKAYDQAPRIVLSAVNEDGLALPVYARKVDGGFEIVTNTVPEAGKTYQFDYIIIGSESITAAAP